MSDEQEKPEETGTPGDAFASDQDTQPPQKPHRAPRSIDELTPENIEDDMAADVAFPGTDHQTITPALAPSWQGRIRIGGFLLLGVVCLAVVAALIAGDFRDTVLRFVHDDAFYYFGIADHMAAGHGSTFDGVTSTNGYHPLWQWLLVPVAAVLGNAADLGRASGVAGVAMLGLAAWLLYRVLRREQYASAAFPLWWIAGALVPATIYGLESPLAALAFATLVWYEAADEDVRRGAGWVRGLVAGILASILFLSRIDALIWVGALDLIVLIEMGRKQRREGFVFALFAAQALLIGGYFLLNNILWGHSLTVSAMVKAGRAGWFPLTFPWSLLCLLSFALAPVSLWALTRRPLLAWIGLGNLIYLAMIVGRGGRETFNWYFTIPVVSGAILIPCFIEEAPLVPRRLAAIGAFLLALAILAVGVRGKVVKPSKFVDRYDMAMALAQLEPNAWTIAMTDCGIVGALGKQKCINLDGLTSSFDMQDALGRGTLSEWLRDAGLNAHVIDRAATPSKATVITARPGIAGIGREATVDLQPGPEMPGRWNLMRVTGFHLPTIPRHHARNISRTPGK